MDFERLLDEALEPPSIIRYVWFGNGGLYGFSDGAYLIITEIEQPHSVEAVVVKNGVATTSPPITRIYQHRVMAGWMSTIDQTKRTSPEEDKAIELAVQELRDEGHDVVPYKRQSNPLREAEEPVVALQETWYNISDGTDLRRVVLVEFSDGVFMAIVVFFEPGFGEIIKNVVIRNGVAYTGPKALIHRYASISMLSRPTSVDDSHKEYDGWPRDPRTARIISLAVQELRDEGFMGRDPHEDEA